MVNVVVAYVLWLFGGILGLHHLYLNRPKHFFIWFVTWGGMVLGWLSEASRIPEYVQEANHSVEYQKRLKEMKKASPKPEFNFVLLASSLMIGHQLSGLLVSAVPEDYILVTWYGPYLAHVLAALGASTGVYLVANMGPQEAPFLLPFLASACTFPASYFLYNRQPIINLICIIVACYVSSEHAQWTKTKKSSGTLLSYLKVLGFAWCCVAVYGTLWTSNMYFNVRVATLNGTVIPLREAVANFMQTRPMAEASDAAKDFMPCVRLYGMEACQKQFLGKLVEISDPERDKWAFNVLGFTQYPNQKQINSHCRKLSSKWHPDKFAKSGDKERTEAEKMFIDIQKACGMLNRIKQKRERQNTWRTDDDGTEETVVVDDNDISDDYEKECTDDGCEEMDGNDSEFDERDCGDVECEDREEDGAEVAYDKDSEAEYEDERDTKYTSDENNTNDNRFEEL